MKILKILWLKAIMRVLSILGEDQLKEAFDRPKTDLRTWPAWICVKPMVSIRDFEVHAPGSRVFHHLTGVSRSFTWKSWHLSRHAFPASILKSDKLSLVETQ